MRETCELRVDEDFANQLFGPNEGKRLGDSIRKVELDTTDPRFYEAGRLQAELRRTKKKPFFYGWLLRRRYTPIELDAAELLQLSITSVFEPAGEECGTVYDTSSVCPHCGAGRRQVSELVLDTRRVPKRADIARTIGYETVISDRMAALVRKHAITGVELHPVKNFRQTNAKLPAWYQLSVTSRPVSIAPPTKTGIDPFDLDPEGKYRCPLGHRKGFNILSEAFLSRKEWDGSDVCCTREVFGLRSGLLVPSPLFLSSPRLWRVLREEKVKGCAFEIAHFQ